MEVLKLMELQEARSTDAEHTIIGQPSKQVYIFTATPPFYSGHSLNYIFRSDIGESDEIFDKLPKTDREEWAHLLPSNSVASS